MPVSQKERMKIIFSRKGFDSTDRYGGKPSPIINGTTPISLPIPEDKKKTIEYQNLTDPTGQLANLGEIVAQFTGGIVDGKSFAHLDPDLRWDTYPRREGWRPIFGQVDQAQTHLSNQGVGQGDVFLFYGLYCDANISAGTIAYARGADWKHVIWGWLAIGDIFKPRCEEDVPIWARYHAHATDKRSANNTIYVAANSAVGNLPGAGIFSAYSDDLCLTDLQTDHVKPSVWRLPLWCAPRDGRYALTYHPNANVWTIKSDCVLLQTKSPAQEFVLDTAQYAEAIPWARNLIARHGRGWESSKARTAKAGKES